MWLEREEREREQRARVIGDEARKVKGRQEWGQFVGHSKDLSSYLE